MSSSSSTAEIDSHAEEILNFLSVVRKSPWLCRNSRKRYHCDENIKWGENIVKSNSEKFYEGFQRFLAEQGHEESSEAEMDALLQQYVTMLNAGDVSLEPMQDEESADAFLERAQEAGSRREMLKWIRKARELEPDHVDAALMEIEETSKNPYEQEMRLFELQQKAEKQLREQGYFRKASIGDFWGLIETRPYMRVCQTYVGTLLMNRKMRLAAKACESMLRLCKNDRYTLILWVSRRRASGAQAFWRL